MPSTFKIKKVTVLQEVHWVPDWPGLENKAFVLDSADMTFEQKRGYLFSLIDQEYPGEFTLDYSMEDAKAQAFVKIDKRSDEYFSAGFEFEGMRFSLTLEAQTRMTAMMMLADQFQYPIGINSLDDLSILYLQNAQHTQAWCGTALYTVKGIVDSGTQQKDFIRAQTDVQTVLNYNDPRPSPVIVPEPGEPLPSTVPEAPAEPTPEPAPEPTPEPAPEPEPEPAPAEPEPATSENLPPEAPANDNGQEPQPAQGEEDEAQTP